VKRAAALLGFGIAAVLAQGVVNGFVPARFTPDLSLLVVVAVGLHWRGAAGGVAIATLLGFAADLMSASLLGEHALLRLLEFGAARFASRHLNLRGPIPQAVFVVVLTAANALGIGLLNSFFTARGGIDLVMLRNVVPHAFANALFAPLFSRLFENLTNALGDDEGGRRLLRLEPRGRAT
jgi:rod shape-determining protein MreD